MYFKMSLVLCFLAWNGHRVCCFANTVFFTSDREFITHIVMKLEILRHFLVDIVDHMVWHVVAKVITWIAVDRYCFQFYPKVSKKYSLSLLLSVFVADACCYTNVLSLCIICYTNINFSPSFLVKIIFVRRECVNYANSSLRWSRGSSLFQW